MSSLDLVYRDDCFQIEVGRFSEDFSRPLILSFSNYLSNDYSSKAFSESFCKKRDLNFIAIKSRYNKWYHNLSDFYLDKIKDVISSLGGAYRLVLTGSSMGGTAAIIFAKHLHAKQVIAFSPQFSIECRFEHRYKKEIGRFDKVYDVEDSSLYSDSVEYIIVYDPFDPDGEHYNKYRGVINPGCIRGVSLPFSGHPSIALIRDVGVLSNFVWTLISKGELISLSKVRKRSLVYFVNLTTYLYKKKKYKLGLSVVCKVMERLSQYKFNEGAVFDLTVNKTRFLTKCGFFDDARVVVDGLIKSFPTKSIGYLLAVDLICESAEGGESIKMVVESAVKAGLSFSIFESRAVVLSNAGFNINGFLS